MNGDVWTEKVVAEIRALDGPNWKDRVEWFVSQAGRACAVGEIGEGAYIRIYEAAEGRKTRTAASQARHERPIRAEDNLYGYVSEHIAHLKEAEPEAISTAVAPKIRAGVRGPSRYTPEERAERILEQRERADKAKLPACLSRHYGRAELAAMSEILFAIVQSASATCNLALEAIAARARCSKRRVQDALSVAKRLGHLLTQRRGPAPLQISVLHAEIKAWLLGPDPCLLMEKIEEIQEDIKSPSLVAEICHSDGPNPAQEAAAGAESPTAGVGADRRPLLPARPQSNPTAIPSHGRIEASRWGAWAAIVPPRSTPKPS